MRESIFLKNVKFAKPVAHYLILGRRIFRVFLIAKNEKKLWAENFFPRDIRRIYVLVKMNFYTGMVHFEV